MIKSLFDVKAPDDTGAESGTPEPSAPGRATSAEPKATPAEGVPVRPFSTWRADWNTLGHGRAFAGLYGHACRFSYDEQAWYVYDSRHWVKDSGERMDELAARVRARYLQDVTHLARQAGDDRAKAFAAHIAATLSTPKALRMMIEAAKVSMDRDGIVTLAVDANVFDRHRHLLCVPNCIVDLRSGASLPHDPDLFLSRMAPTPYQPRATAPRFMEAVQRMMAGDTERLAFLQRVLGYLLTGEARERKVVVFHGSGGGNGKSTLTSILAGILGPAHVSGLPVSTLLDKRFGADEIDVGLTSISGKRVVVAVEPNRGARFATGVVKALSGNDAVGVMARRPHQKDLVAVRPGAKIVIVTNHLPTWEDDQAFNERFLIVPFNETFLGRGEHRDLATELLSAEAPGILAWLVEGAVAYYARGLDAPPEIVRETAEYHRDADIVGSWFAACCERDPAAATSTSELYQSYRAHARNVLGLPETDLESLKMFTASLARFSDRRERRRLPGVTNAVSVVVGVRLRTHAAGPERDRARAASAWRPRAGRGRAGRAEGFQGA